MASSNIVDWLTADPANFELAWPQVKDWHTNKSLVFVQMPIAYADEADAFIFRWKYNGVDRWAARIVCDECAYDNNRDEFDRPIGECIPVRLVCSANCYICGDHIDKGVSI